MYMFEKKKNEMEDVMKKTSAPEEKSPPASSEELFSTLKRVQADFENYQKRAQQEMNVHYLRGKASALKEMLSIMDTLDSAIAKEKNGAQRALESVRTHVLHILKQDGVRPIETMGKIFDPFTSECLMQGNDPTQPEDVVLLELQRGYYFHEDVLRSAKVKVNKLEEKNSMETTAQSTNGKGGGEDAE